MIFDYPDPRSERRHGPAGYVSYESYRPWLRDEFDFRCVYCLKREAWGQVTGDFDIDHFEPQAIQSDRRCDYLNLVYACRRCNAVKHDQAIADPFSLLNSATTLTLPDGSVVTSHADAQRLVRQLDLNSPRLKKWRVMWMRIVALARTHEAELFSQLIGLPNELPNLSRLRPPQNSRKQGLEQSWHAKRARGDAAEFE